MPLLIPVKFMVEFRYPARALFHDAKGFICDNFQSPPFTEWRINPNQIELHSKNRLYSTTLTSKNAAMFAEVKTNRDEFLGHLRRYARLVCRKLNITSLSRVGARMFLIIPHSNFHDASRIFRESIFPNIDEQLAQIGSVYDYNFLWDLTTNDRKAHFRIGPMEINQLLEIFILGEIEKDDLPEAFIFVDFDIYKEKPEFTTQTYNYISQFVDSSTREILSRTHQFFEGLGIELGD